MSFYIALSLPRTKIIDVSQGKGFWVNLAGGEIGISEDGITVERGAEIGVFIALRLRRTKITYVSSGKAFWLNLKEGEIGISKGYVKEVKSAEIGVLKRNRSFYSTEITKNEITDVVSQRKAFRLNHTEGEIGISKGDIKVLKGGEIGVFIALILQRTRVKGVSQQKAFNLRDRNSSRTAKVARKAATKDRIQTKTK